MGARFDFDCTEAVGVACYFEGRARQLLADEFVPLAQFEQLYPEDGSEQPWGAQCWVEREGQRFTSVYVYAQARGRGHMRRWQAARGETIVTTPDCAIEQALERIGARFIVAGQHTQRREYRAIAAHYGGRRAARSGAQLMNHIDEGLALLRWLGAGEAAERAYCLHPLVQGDAELADADLDALTESPRVLALALEYRSVANGYLSPMGSRAPGDIRLSPLSEVNDMLRADKIQNFADFLRFHARTHPRAAELDAYFRAWLQRLEIPQSRFEQLRDRLRVPSLLPA